MDLILIAGMPAAGKTSIGRRLSGDLKIPMLSKDSIKEILFDTVGFKSREEKNALGVAAFQMMHDAAKNILLCGGSVILENNFDNASKPDVMRLIAQTCARTLTVLVDCEYAEVYRRYVKRDQSPERHRGHVLNTIYPEPAGAGTSPYAPLPCNTLQKGMEARGFRTFDVGGERIEIDTTDFDSFDYPALLDNIRERLRGPV